MRHHPGIRLVLTSVATIAVAPGMSLAYVGPGAGFAVLSGGLVLVGTLLLAIGIVAAYPVKVSWRLVTGKGRIRGKTKRLVILGFDGLDPGLAKQFMDEGRMPNLKAMGDSGHFGPLASSCPSMSPVAWSSFTTGVDASRHNIFDFITRDPCTYLPILSSTQIETAEKALVSIGKHRFWSRPSTSIRILRKARPWWSYLGERKIFSNIIRVPITFPPERFHGALLSGMCVPDLKGTQGSFSYFTTQPASEGPEAGGDIYRVTRTGDTVSCAISGPPDPRDGKKALEIPLVIKVVEDGKRVALTIGTGKDAQHVELELRSYSPWITLTFMAGRQKVSGIARFYCVATTPELGLYMTAIQIDPENPAMPISHPLVYSIYLAKKLGPFATLGLAEDTWALNERVIDEPAFWAQTVDIWEERRKQLHDALDNTRQGAVVCVFDGTDRVSHMFWRYLEDDHPANAGKDREWGRDKVAEIYSKADAVVGEVRARLKPERDRLLVISDHGFGSFRRGVNVNAWLRDRGMLVMKDDAPVDAPTGKALSRDWCQDVDWKRTKAFCLGLTGIFINRKGRERDGIVAEGEELAAVKREIREGLLSLLDPKSGEAAFREVYVTSDEMSGPYLFEAPDLLLGYRRGFRNSWDCAKGACTVEVFTDNTKSWSGDHCVDPREVPGVLFAEAPIAVEDPDLRDLAPTALELFGARVPRHMQGRSLFAAGKTRA